MAEIKSSLHLVPGRTILGFVRIGLYRSMPLVYFVDLLGRGKAHNLLDETRLTLNTSLD